MQTTGNLVRDVIELAAGMQHREDDFGGRAPLLGMDIHRNAASVIRDGHRLIGMDGDHDAVAVAGQGLVDRVVDDLKHHVVQPRPVIGVPDVHSGAFPHRIKTL